MRVRGEGEGVGKGEGVGEGEGEVRVWVRVRVRATIAFVSELFPKGRELFFRLLELFRQVRLLGTLRFG